MNRCTRQKKETDLISLDCPQERIAELIDTAKSCFDRLIGDIKLNLVQFLLSSERELLAGPKYHPFPGWEKWGAQEGSVYVGGERVKVKRPRLRKDSKEIPLSTYQELRKKERFSDEILEKALRGISCREYEESLNGLLDNFGISRSAVSRHLKVATTAKLKELKERSFEEVEAFAIFIDGYHIGGKVFIVALLIDMDGKKHVLGFWEGATENHSVCSELLNDVERRGLILDEKVLFITDGGKGIIKALNDKFGKLLQHQRCTIHKDRNIQNHLPKKYRKEAHRMFRNAIDLNHYDDAREELRNMERWLDNINPSAAESLREAFDELLTVHRLGVPPLLRKTLHSTNPIESMFSQVSHRMGKINYMRGGSKMAQRWLGTALLHAEEKFRTVKGYLSIKEVRARMESIQREIKASVA